MKVLLLTSMYPPHHYGGYELSCRDVVERWRGAGHEVTVLAGDLRIPGVHDDPGQVGVRRELTVAFRDHGLVAAPVHRRLADERRNQRALASALADTAPDVVSIWQMGAMSLGLLSTLVRTGLPLVYVICDDWLSYGASVDPWMRMFVEHPRVGRAVERLTGVPATLPDLGRSGTFCFASAATRERAERLSRWTYPDATVSFLGVDRDAFPPFDARPEWGWRLLHVGRLDPRKGIETAVRALGHLPATATLDIVGRGDESYRRRLAGAAASLGVTDRVRFSAADRPQVANHYRQADVVLFPTEWEEPFGLVPLEAMASGTPVVATGTGGSGEFLVDGGNCLLVPPADPAALAAAVTLLAGDAGLRNRIVSNGMATAAQLDVDRLSAFLEEWHQAAVAGFAGGRPATRQLGSLLA